MSTRTIGVLVMSYGTPESLDQIEAYYTHIRRGKPPTNEQLQSLRDRYEAIVGGFFPLRENTNKQVAALEQTLNKDHSGSGITYKCYQGLKHAFPFIEDGIAQMSQDGIQEAVGIVLAPHYSVMSVGGYIKRAQDAAQLQSPGLKIDFVRQYHLHPKLLKALSSRVERGLGRFAERDRSKVRVIFSAHSLPAQILEMNDPYPDQLLETSKAIADKVGIDNWQFAWQSAGQTATPWLGPDILDVLETVSKEEQVEHVLMCPVGFVSDHLEVLYDIDIECKQRAKELGIQLERTESLNTDPLYMETLSEVIGALS
ncbi:MAG: ferrochelatase [Paenibacillus sp.]|nr:ferrochelatase [Paenibacillus sp.]